jgi:ADP-ribose pyrophosphatase
MLRLVIADHWEYAERVNASGVVAIVAVTADDELVLTEQHRTPVGTRVVDLPAGLAGDVQGARSEDFASAARRELIEEVGYDARRFEFLASAPTSPGLTSEVVSFFRAVGLKQVADGGGVDGENIQIHRVKLSAADAWLRRRARTGVMIDCKTYAGLYFARSKPTRSRGSRK